MSPKCRIAIAIPCHNSERELHQVVSRAFDYAVDVKLFAVDSGSTDSTWDILEELHREGKLAGIARCELGRSNALNAAAALALESEWSPELIMFLHSDTLVPRGYDQAARTIMQRPGVALGHFRFQWEGVENNPAMQFNQWYVNQRCSWVKLPWGDQAFVVARKTFESVGGFPAIPIMEDTAFLLACEKLGTTECTGLTISTRPAKLLEAGVHWGCLRQMVRNHVFTVCWLIGFVTSTQIYSRYYKG
eukprot:gene13734-16232_t